MTHLHGAGRLRTVAALVVAALAAAPARGQDAPETPGRGCDATRPLEYWRAITGGVVVPDALAFPAPGTRPPPRQRLRLMAPIAVAARGQDVFVIDATRGAVLRFDAGFDRVSVFAETGMLPLGMDLAVDRDRSVWVLDPARATIVRYDRSGLPVARLEGGDAIADPVALAADAASGTVLVADGLRGQAVVFDGAGAVAGTLGASAEPPPFGRIDALARGPGALYVLDRTARTVHALGADGAWAAFGPDRLGLPVALAADRWGRVLVADGADNLIEVYAGGRWVAAVGGEGPAPGRFAQVADLWVDEDALYVADTGNARIAVFRILPPCE